jgi:Putative zinc-finger
MTLLACQSVRERLVLFHDGELSVDEHILVQSHVEECRWCAAEVAQLSAIGNALRDAAAELQPSAEMMASLQPNVVGRVQAEAQQALPARVARMFEDMHFVWAGFGATAAALLCAGVVSTMLNLAVPVRADSLSAILTTLGSPGSDENPLLFVYPQMSIPRVVPPNTMPTAFSSEDRDTEDVVFALAAVVTQEGRIANPEVLLANRREREKYIRLVDALTKARFEPAQLAGSPVAVNMVWLFARTTVRAKMLS